MFMINACNEGFSKQVGPTPKPFFWGVWLGAPKTFYVHCTKKVPAGNWRVLQKSPEIDLIFCKAVFSWAQLSCKCLNYGIHLRKMQRWSVTYYSGHIINLYCSLKFQSKCTVSFQALPNFANVNVFMFINLLNSA